MADAVLPIFLLKFRRLILRKKIIIILVTGRQILRQKCTKFDFAWGPQQTPLGELSKTPCWTLRGLRGEIERGKVKEGSEEELKKEIKGRRMMGETVQF